MNVVLGENLAKYRKKAGYSQEELADKLGVSRQAVSKWERGEASPDTENLIALSRLYGVTLDECTTILNKLKNLNNTKLYNYIKKTLENVRQDKDIMSCLQK